MKQGWTYKTLGEIATSMYRGSGIRRDQVTNDGIPCVRYGEIYTTYNISFNECVSHTQESLIPNPKYFEHGDLLFAITGESVEDIGKTIAYLGNEKCLLGGDIICMKHNENPKYLSYALSTPDAIRQKGIGKTKLKVVHTNAPSLQSIKIPLPSPAEQERIVERLDAAFAQIDELKSNAERQLAEARALFQSALTQAMQPKPGWQEKKMGQICKIERGGSPRPIKQFITDSPDGVNWIKIGDTDPQGKYIFSTKEKIKPEGIRRSRWVEENDFLLSNSMSFGRPYILKTNGCIHDGWLVLRDYQESLDIDYFYYLLTSSIVQKQFRTKAQGSTVSNLNTDRVADVTVYYPSIDQQKTIASQLDALSSHVRELEGISRKTAAECDALKQALLRQIFE